MILQLICILPTSGSWSKNCNITYSCKSFTTILNIIFTVLKTLESVIYICVYIKYGFGYISSMVLLYYYIDVCIHVLFHLWAQRWPKLVKKFEELEKPFTNIAIYTNKDKQLKRYCLIYIIIASCVTAYTYIIFEAWRFNNAEQELKICNISTEHIARYFYSKNYEPLFSVIDFKFWMIPIFECMLLLGQMTW